MRTILTLCALVIGGASILPAADAGRLTTGNTAFALDLYGRLRKEEGNLFCSPYSISTALAMTYGGARGATAEQMAMALHFELPQEALHPAFAAMERGIADIEKKGKVKIAVANSLWPQKKFALLPEFLTLCQKNYGAEITPLDFAGSPDKARNTINRWVEDKTNKKITDLIQSLDSLTRLVLVNAIYFKGDWANQFKSELTQKQPFYVSPDKTSEASLMHQTKDFGYGERDGLQILDLPYAGDDLSMVVILPNKADGLGDLEAKLTVKHLADWVGGLRSRKVELFLPKFKMTRQFSLNEELAALGMRDAFSDKADFSGLDGQRDLFISTVIHKAFVEVDEKGTEAAAATAVVLMEKASIGIEPPTPVFRADHPFLFLIRDRSTGSILFLGRVVNPAA